MRMQPVLLAGALVIVLVVVALAFAWQERRPPGDDAVIYGVEDALAFVMARLSDESAALVGRADVRRILEWEMRYLQDPSLRDSEVAVVGGMDAADYAQRRAMAQGHPYEPSAIIEVLELQAAYLATLGAVGDPVTAEEVAEITAAEGVILAGEEVTPAEEEAI